MGAIISHKTAPIINQRSYLFVGRGEQGKEIRSGYMSPRLLGVLSVRRKWLHHPAVWGREPMEPNQPPIQPL